MVEYEAKTTKMSNDITDIGEKIQREWQNTSTGTASYVRKLARKSAEFMNEYGVFISQSNKEYESLWDVFENSISNLIINPIINDNLENKKLL